MRNRLPTPAALVLSAAGVAFALLLMPGSARAPQPIPTVTAPASTSAPAAPTDEPAPTATSATRTKPALAIRFTDTMGFSRELIPPNYEGVSRIEDESAGYSAGPKSTTFLLAHARTTWRGHSAGNEWQRLAIGDQVTVDGKQLTVSQAFTVEKTAIAGVEGLWEHHTGRTVLITCVPRDDGATATHNRVTILPAE